MHWLKISETFWRALIFFLLRKKYILAQTNPTRYQKLNISEICQLISTNKVSNEIFSLHFLMLSFFPKISIFSQKKIFSWSHFFEMFCFMPTYIYIYMIDLNIWGLKWIFLIPSIHLAENNPQCLKRLIDNKIQKNRKGFGPSIGRNLCQKI